MNGMGVATSGMIHRQSTITTNYYIEATKINIKNSDNKINIVSGDNKINIVSGDNKINIVSGDNKINVEVEK